VRIVILTKFSKVGLDITEHKPKMKPIYVAKPEGLRAIPVSFGKTTLQVKADGEFNLIHVDRNGIYAVNRFGRKTEELPALKELHTQFLHYPYLQECELLAEMYAVSEDGKPLSLPNFIHYLKGEDKSLQNRIHLGLFDFLFYQSDIVGRVKRENTDSATRFKMLEGLNGILCHVLPWVEPRDWLDIEDAWSTMVEGEGWEGLVVRVNGDTYKAKPNRDIDAVIIGINKNNKGYEKGLAKSVRVALLREDGNFVELGDATVPSEAEARELFALTRVKVGEDPSLVLVKPLVVVQINYISLFPETINGVRDGKTLRCFGTTVLARMKSPRVVGYRKDKKVCVEDVGLNQIGE
jgi:ATP-dependent DNA ligase